MDKQGQKLIEVKEEVFQELPQDRQALAEEVLAEQVLAEEGFSADSILARAELSASDETASSEQGYFMLGATDKMFSDSSSVLDSFALNSAALDSSASDWHGYFMLGATDKMFSDSSPASGKFGDSSIDTDIGTDIDTNIGTNLASASIVPDKVGFVGERDGSVEVVRYGQRLILHEGDAIFHKDIVITGDDSGAFLRFTNSKTSQQASQQTLRLDEEQRVVIEDFLAEALVSQLDTPDMDWQMSDGSLVLLPSSDDLAIGYEAGSARARFLQTDSSEADSSEADASGAYSSGAYKSAYKLASREGSLQSESSRASEYQTGGLSELDHFFHTQEFPQGDSLGGNLKEPLAQNAPATQEVPADQTADATSDPASPLSQQDLSSQGLSSQGLSSQGLSSQGLSSQSSPPSGYGSPLGDPSVPTAEELARLAQEQARAYAQQREAEEQAREQQAAEEQARAQQAAEEQARAQQAAEEQARAQQAAEEQARAQQEAEEQARAQQAAEEQARAQQAAEEQARAQQAAEEQALAQQAAEEQALAQQAAEEQARAQQAAEDKEPEQKEAEDKEPEQKDFLFSSNGDWNSDLTQTSSELWDPQSSEASSAPASSGYSLYEENADDGGSAGAGATSGF